MDRHRKLGLIDSERMFMVTEMVDGVPSMEILVKQKFGKTKKLQCIDCIESKGKRELILQQTCRHARPLEPHTSMIGNINIPSLGGAH